MKKLSLWTRLLCYLLGHKHFAPRVTAFYSYPNDFHYFCVRCEKAWGSR